jgi:tRNA(Ile2) C34 agmatinyltransferase TiaS
MRPRETLDWNKNASSGLWVKIREGLMDQITRCPKCGKRMAAVVTISGRTDLQCISCDEPAVAESPRTAPEKPVVPAHV